MRNRDSKITTQARERGGAYRAPEPFVGFDAAWQRYRWRRRGVIAVVVVAPAAAVAGLYSLALAYALVAVEVALLLTLSLLGSFRCPACGAEMLRTSPLRGIVLPRACWCCGLKVRQTVRWSDVENHDPALPPNWQLRWGPALGLYAWLVATGVILPTGLHVAANWKTKDPVPVPSAAAFADEFPPRLVAGRWVEAVQAGRTATIVSDVGVPFFFYTTEETHCPTRVDVAADVPDLLACDPNIEVRLPPDGLGLDEGDAPLSGPIAGWRRQVKQHHPYVEWVFIQRYGATGTTLTAFGVYRDTVVAVLVDYRGPVQKP